LAESGAAYRLYSRLSRSLPRAADRSEDVVLTIRSDERALRASGPRVERVVPNALAVGPRLALLNALRTTRPPRSNRLKRGARVQPITPAGTPPPTFRYPSNQSGWTGGRDFKWASSSFTQRRCGPESVSLPRSAIGAQTSSPPAAASATAKFGGSAAWIDSVIRYFVMPRVFFARSGPSPTRCPPAPRLAIHAARPAGPN